MAPETTVASLVGALKGIAPRQSGLWSKRLPQMPWWAAMCRQWGRIAQGYHQWESFRGERLSMTTDTGSREVDHMGSSWIGRISTVSWRALQRALRSAGIIPT
jgi:hypothetical protein